MIKQIDNSNLPAKLKLRRYFLDRYHQVDGSVLDCCAGDRVIWSSLKKEYPHLVYLGVDHRDNYGGGTGRLKANSVRLLKSKFIPQNIIDIDTYGSPWEHWEALLCNISHPTTVFLTCGSVGNISNMSNCDKRALGLTFKRLTVPMALYHPVLLWAVDLHLGKIYDHGIELVEAAEASSGGNARYIGVRLEK